MSQRVFGFKVPRVNPEFRLLSSSGHVEDRNFISVDRKSFFALESSAGVALSMLSYSYIMFGTVIKMLEAENISPETIRKLIKLLESINRCQQHLSNILCRSCSDLMLVRRDSVLKSIPDLAQKILNELRSSYLEIKFLFSVTFKYLGYRMRRYMV